MPKVEEEKKATPRQDWLKENGVELQWRYLSGDPAKDKDEPVQFVFALRRAKEVGKGPRPRGAARWEEVEWELFSYTMGTSLFPKYLARMEKDFHHPETHETHRKYCLVPDVEAFLSSIMREVREVAEGNSFEEWCAELGDARDAVRSHRIWEDIQHNWTQLRRLLGHKARDFTSLDIEDDHT